MNILIVGGNSAIAVSIARLYATEGHTFTLLGRNQNRLSANATDLLVRGAKSVACVEYDAGWSLELQVDALKKALAAQSSVDLVLLAFGVLPETSKLESNSSIALETIQTNYASCVYILLELAKYFEAHPGGRIAVITSVAGDCSRRSSYLYSSTKAALSSFLRGYRHRLLSCRTSVTDIRPGFVDTPMTEGFAKGALFASPERIAADTVKAISAGKRVVYTPWFWRLIMTILQHTPDFILRRLPI